MRLALSFATHGPLQASWSRLELPMELELPQGKFSIKSNQQLLEQSYVSLPDLVPANEFLFILGECTANPTKMELVESNFGHIINEDGARRKYSVIRDEDALASLAEGAHCVAGALSFATGVGLHPGVFVGLARFNCFFADDSEDQALLKKLGTGRSALPLSGPNTVEAFDSEVVNSEFVKELAQRHCTAIYPNVLSAVSPALKFRELWRVLEMAFQSHGREMIELLIDFPPIKKLGFDRNELDQLRALRGRLSHAASRLGLRDIGRADEEATEALGRLWSLVDCVVLSKEDSSRSLEVDELKPLLAFISKERAIETTSAIHGDPQDWLHSWGLHSARFH